MCSNMGGRAAIPAAAAAAQVVAPAAAAQQAAPAPARTSGLVSDTGIQDMDDAALTSLIQQAQSAAAPTDRRDDTLAQRIADALGISANQPESVRQEALAQYRGQTYEQGTLYRTVNDGAIPARQIAHDLTDATDSYGLNYGGGRVWGTGLYFAGTGHNGYGNAGARESAGYGWTNPYTIEARLKPTARIATLSDLTGPKGRAWMKAHAATLNKLGIGVYSHGGISSRYINGMTDDDATTTLAMLMGYDGFRNGDTSSPYYTIWNRGALQVARGNKYDRASRGQL